MKSPTTSLALDRILALIRPTPIPARSGFSVIGEHIAAIHVCKAVVVGLEEFVLDPRGNNMSLVQAATVFPSSVNLVVHS